MFRIVHQFQLVVIENNCFRLKMTQIDWKKLWKSIFLHKIHHFYPLWGAYWYSLSKNLMPCLFVWRMFVHFTVLYSHWCTAQVLVLVLVWLSMCSFSPFGVHLQASALPIGSPKGIEVRDFIDFHWCSYFLINFHQFPLKIIILYNENWTRIGAGTSRFF